MSDPHAADDDATGSDPAEIEPTDNSTGAAVDLDRVQDVEGRGSAAAPD